MTWIDIAIDEYCKFIKDGIKAEPLNNGWYVITTPFLGMFNDYIQVYCRNDKGIVTIFDGGDTIVNLELMGVNITRSKTKRHILEQILQNYNVKLTERNELLVQTDVKGFAQAKQNLLSAIIETSDLSMLAKHNVTSVFAEDVANYLQEQQIIYTPAFIAKGRSGLEFTFTFQVAGIKSELLINTFNIINKVNLATFLFNWKDIQEERQRKARKSVSGLAIINDLNKEVKSQYLNALEAKGTDFILYSQRHRPENIQKLKIA